MTKGASLSKFAASEKGKTMRVKIDQAKDAARAASNRVIKLANDHKDKEAISLSDQGGRAGDPKNGRRRSMRTSGTGNSQQGSLRGDAEGL